MPNVTPSMGYRKIIHVDMDAFFASVEQRDHPELKGKPIAVGYDGPRGVVSTASYEARRFGVHSAMAMSTAKRYCPLLIVVGGNYERYREALEYMTLFHQLLMAGTRVSQIDPESPVLDTLLEDFLRRQGYGRAGQVEWDLKDNQMPVSGIYVKAIRAGCACGHAEDGKGE